MNVILNLSIAIVMTVSIMIGAGLIAGWVAFRDEQVKEN